MTVGRWVWAGNGRSGGRGGGRAPGVDMVEVVGMEEVGMGRWWRREESHEYQEERELREKSMNEE